MMVRRAGDALLDLIYPPCCPVCGEAADRVRRIHPECEKKLVLIREPRCKKCSKPLEAEEAEYCFDCSRKHFSYERGMALWIYNGAMSRSAARFKYKNKREFGDYYSREIVRHLGGEIRRMRPDALVPVPIHTSRRRERGYNQAEILADGIGRRMQIPVLKGYLKRTRKTVAQKKLNDRQRLANLMQAFSTEGKPLPAGIKTVVLVDDIYTTGSTVEACTRVLLAAGVQRVYFVAVCIGSGF